MGVKQRADGRRVGDVGLTGDGASTRGLDIAHNLGGEVGIGEIVHRDREAVAGQASGRRRTDAARRAADNGCASGVGLPCGRGRSLR